MVYSDSGGLGGAPNSAFPTSSQVRPLLLICSHVLSSKATQNTRSLCHLMILDLKYFTSVNQLCPVCCYKLEGRWVCTDRQVSPGSEPAGGCGPQGTGVDRQGAAAIEVILLEDI